MLTLNNVLAGFGAIMLSWCLLCFLAPALANYTQQILRRHEHGMRAFWYYVGRAFRAYAHASTEPKVDLRGIDG